MTSKMTVVRGPMDCGNVFGYLKKNLVPAGRFVVVEYGEYANGGRGPSLVVDRSFASEEEATAELQRLQQQK